MQPQQDLDWKENNLEYDLRNTEWICAKAKQHPWYAQNIYAALCNQIWQRHDVWPILKGQTWSCSWRYAGGIVADMVGQGSYLDYYCSGIGGGLDLSTHTSNNLFVGEGVVTEEIQKDFLKLGWTLVTDHELL